MIYDLLSKLHRVDKQISLVYIKSLPTVYANFSKDIKTHKYGVKTTCTFIFDPFQFKLLVVLK